MAEDQKQPQEPKKNILGDDQKAVEVILEHIEQIASWSCFAVDRMYIADALIFYMRSTDKHKFLSALDTPTHDFFDCWVRVSGQLARRNPKQTLSGIIKYCGDDLKMSKNCLKD